MKFEPFTKIEDIEEFFNHSIIYGKMEMVVIGANYSDNGILYIQTVDENGNEFSMSAIDWFYYAKYKGHNFGKRIKEVEE